MDDDVARKNFWGSVGKIFGFTRRLRLTSTEGWRSPGAETDAGEHVSENNVLALSAVWACVNLLAGTIGSLPIMVFRIDAEGVQREARDHPLFRMLHDSPNADDTALDFWEFMTAAVELRGNAYARKVKIGGRTVSLRPVYPDLMSVRRDEARRLRYRWSQDGETFDLDQDDVFHVRGFGGDSTGGLSTIAACRQTFGLALAINKSASSFFRNGMRPTGILKFKEWLKPEQRTLAEDRLVEKYVGATNAGKPFIAEGGVDWTQLTVNPEDAQMLESRGFAIEDIARLFGVPPFMIGHTEKTTSFGTGLEQQVLGFQKFTLRRRLKRFEQAIAKQLLTAEDRGQGVSVAFNVEGLLRADTAARSAFYTAMLNAGVMTINEVRALENLPPVPGGDVPRMQMQNVPITQSAGIGHNGGPPLEDAA